MIDRLQAALADCQVADIYRLQTQLRSLSRIRNPDQRVREIQALKAAIQASRDACKPRIEAIPQVLNYPEQLPFTEKVEEIATLLKQHQVLVVAGDTGSGKTTQLPKICLQAGLGRRGLIGHTQPRRLAAVSVANRIAEELGVNPGEGVGYQIRFTERLSAGSFLKIMTDGILLSEIQQDRFLNKYEVIIIDEAHERSLNIDFLLGYLRWLLHRRPELKLIITSATIDVEKFADHFGSAPIVLVSGRTFPVKVRYAPLHSVDASPDSGDLQISGITRAIQDIREQDKQQKRMSGDILVFLSTERDIRDTATALRKLRLPDTEILPLYARLRQSEQIRIFQPHRGRRIVLSTNVAETSITVPGINYVIDTGLARISRYSLQNKVQRLPVEPVSQASADQRKGRCGRVANGICIRLYSENDFLSRPEYTDPEILRTNLASVILRMQYLGLGDVAEFPFLEPPQNKAINDGFRLLIELSALNHKRQLTIAGKQMARLPVDPRYARMLVTADSERCLTELLVIVSVLGIQDPREQGSENRQQAQERQRRFSHPDSDFLGFVGLWQQYEEERQRLNQNQLKKFCRQHHLSFMRMREWREVHRLLMLGCQQLGFRRNSEPATYAAIHKSIISGSLNQVAMRHEGKTYQGSRNKKLSLFASSVISSKRVKWIVTSDQIETSRTFATLAAKIQPEWVEEKALHLVKREHSGPHWSKKHQQVLAYEKVSLYGLAIMEKKPVPYAPIDGDIARQIFIREGLAAGELQLNARFVRVNRDFLDTLARQEEKIRKPEYFVSDNDIAAFYDKALPAAVNSTASLRSWLKSASAEKKQALEMSMASMFDEHVNNAGSYQATHFPDQTPVNHNRLAIDYRFDPGHERDGATVEIPVAILSQVVQADIDWAVPGIVRDKCVALLKALPKTLRKNFIPVTGFVDEIVPQMLPGEHDFLTELSAQIRRVKRLDIPEELFNKIELPNHLKTKITVIDDDGNELLFGEDVQALKELLPAGHDSDESVATGGIASQHELERKNMKDWDIGDLPDEVQIGDDLVLLRYPAIVDQGDAVSVKLFAERTEADQQHYRGLIRLYQLRTSQQRRMLLKQFRQFIKNNALQLSTGLQIVEEDAVHACYQACFHPGQGAIRSRSHFDEALNAGKQRLFEVSAGLESLLRTVLELRGSIVAQLKILSHSGPQYLITDINGQLQELFAPHFLLDTEWQWLQQYPRYLQAIQNRLRKAPHLGPKDEAHTGELQRFRRRFREWCDRGHMDKRTEIDTIRWMIEEYRVSLFAQSLGTSVPVSSRRLEKALDALK